ncbi:uncharacterized protein [Nicotiana sylvestris]|uniref:Uncharacterized protein LOC104226648 isoform X2 n=1 Tax=Nicotiana sylvestris TaxID=4096 RepID=A0A1U7WAH4_NICSY|nr:PREDICTED: uncharacterized protein LOC104226648 isoform X2 [Nicotiana sylvestris]
MQQYVLLNKVKICHHLHQDHLRKYHLNKAIHHLYVRIQALSKDKATINQLGLVGEEEEKGSLLGKGKGRGTTLGIGRGVFTSAAGSSTTTQPSTFQSTGGSGLGKGKGRGTTLGGGSTNATTIGHKRPRHTSFEIFTDTMTGTTILNPGILFERVISARTFKDTFATNIDIGFKPPRLKFKGRSSDKVIASADECNKEKKPFKSNKFSCIYTVKQTSFCLCYLKCHCQFFIWAVMLYLIHYALIEFTSLGSYLFGKTMLCFCNL